MDREVFVHMDLQGTPYLVGRLWTRIRKDRESATFEYDKSWLAHSERFSLEPVLKLGPGPFHTPSDKPLFGAIGDSAPDRWGRVLMRRVPSAKSTTCSWWMTRHAQARSDSRKGKGGRFSPGTAPRRSRH